MATSRPASASRPTRGPNLRFRELRGRLSPGEFAAAVRRAAREIGENVSCDARYIGRVEAGEIRCPNYAYERVFLHMFPGRTLTDMGFEPRQAVRGRRRGSGPGPRSVPLPSDPHDTEESDVLRRAFMTGGSAALASLISLGTPTAAFASRSPALSAGRPGEREAAAVRQAVREIRVLDDRHGAEILYGPAGRALRSAYAMLDTGARRAAVSDSLHTGTGELAISVGWLAHDSRRPRRPGRTTWRRWRRPACAGDAAWRRTPSATARSSPGTAARRARRCGRPRPGSRPPGRWARTG